MIISDMDMIAQDMVCIAERADGKGKVEGYYFCLHHNDGRTHLHHLIIPLEAGLSRGTPLDQIQVEVVPESITLKAQEPVNPVVDIDTWKCGNCGHALEHQQLLGDNVLLHEQYNYCPECGRAVKWE